VADACELRGRREAAGLTQVTLAELVGVSVSALRAAEGGHGGAATVAKIEAVLVGIGGLDGPAAHEQLGRHLTRRGNTTGRAEARALLALLVGDQERGRMELLFLGSSERKTCAQAARRLAEMCDELEAARPSWDRPR